MSIQVEWDRSTTHAVIRMTFETDWSLAAYYHSIAVVDTMLDGEERPVTVIMDMTATTSTVPRRVPRGHQVDEDRVLCRAERLVLVAPGHFTPHVTCPVEYVATLKAAYKLLDSSMPTVS